MCLPPLLFLHQDGRDIVRRALALGDGQQPVQAGVRPVPVDDLEEHLLIGDGVHQSVGTQQQVLPGVHRAYVPVTVGGDVRSQGPGDIVICCGGGGVPTYFDKNGRLVGAEAVIDKDLASSVLAASLDADLFIIATDVDGAYINWGKPDQKKIVQADPKSLREFGFAKGSMGPKVEAACRFVERTGKTAVIGALSEIEKILAGESGTRVVKEEGVVYG